MSRKPGARLTFNQRAAIAAKLDDLSTDPDHPVFIDYDLSEDEFLPGDIRHDNGEAARIIVDVIVESHYIEQAFLDAQLLHETLIRAVGALLEAGHELPVLDPRLNPYMVEAYVEVMRRRTD